MATTHKIAVLEGDGIGPEITAVALDVLKAVEAKSDVTFELQHAPRSRRLAVFGSQILEIARTQSSGQPLGDPSRHRIEGGVR